MLNLDEPENVKDYLELASYLTEAANDLVKNPDAWENVKLEDFLRAWAAWLKDSPGYYRNMGEDFPEQPSWGEVAGMVLAASMYE
jgi:hypothetical protein